MKQHIETITQLLLGAAYADKHLEGREVEAIRGLLRRLLGVATLPDAQEQQIRTFNPAKFDPRAAAASLATLSGLDKHKLLELIATVNESDDELDLDEDKYLRNVAEGVGLSAAEYEHLALDLLEDDELAGFFDE